MHLTRLTLVLVLSLNFACPTPLSKFHQWRQCRFVMVFYTLIILLFCVSTTWAQTTQTLQQILESTSDVSMVSLIVFLFLEERIVAR